MDSGHLPTLSLLTRELADLLSDETSLLRCHAQHAVALLFLGNQKNNSHTREVSLSVATASSYGLFVYTHWVGPSIFCACECVKVLILPSNYWHPNPQQKCFIMEMLLKMPIANVFLYFSLLGKRTSTNYYIA